MNLIQEFELNPETGRTGVISQTEVIKETADYLLREHEDKMDGVQFMLNLIQYEKVGLDEVQKLAGKADRRVEIFEEIIRLTSLCQEDDILPYLVQRGLNESEIKEYTREAHREQVDRVECYAEDLRNQVAVLTDEKLETQQEMFTRIVESYCKQYNYKMPTDPIQIEKIARGILKKDNLTAEEERKKIEARLDTTGWIERPTFPYWVIKGTSIGEGLVYPVVSESGKHEEFVFMPAVQVMLNYLSGRVRIEYGIERYNLYIGLISPPEQFFKSSSAELAHKYFGQAGILGTLNNSVKSSDGKVMVSKAGSAEGFCLAMAKVGAKNGMLYYDELADFVSKASIEGSTMMSNLLIFYESGLAQNQITSEKNRYCFEAGTYTFGWLFCTTDTAFNRLWPKIAEENTGLASRFFPVLNNNEAKPPKKYHDPSLIEGALKTKGLIDKAMEQGTYKYADFSAASKLFENVQPRNQGLMEKLALYFAIDLGRRAIDADCLQRAIGLVRYRDDALQYLSPIEADTLEGRVQQMMKLEIRKNNGKMPLRMLRRNLNYDRMGARLWNQFYDALLKDAAIIEFGAGTRGDPRMVGLVKQEDWR